MTISGPASTDSSGFLIHLLLLADHAPRQRGSLRTENSFQGPRPHAYIGVGYGVVELVPASFALQRHLERVQSRQPRVAGPYRGAFRRNVIRPEGARRNAHGHDVADHALLGFLIVHV